MALRLPSEIVVDRFLPTARSMLAVELDDYGLTQQEIADRLGVTQAAVSKYVGGDGAVEEHFRDDPRMQETVERIAAGFAHETMDEYEALAELLELIRTFEDRGPICDVHEAEMPELRGLGCDLCARGFDAQVGDERAVLTSVRTAARMLADTPGIAQHVPNVGTNVGMALPDATDELDVAAIPGRIHAMRGRVHIPSNPEFGGSHHVAQIALTAMFGDPTVRSAVNLATSDELLDAARARGVEPLSFDASYEDRAERLGALLEEHDDVPRVVYHEGAFGIEPITYVLGETAVDAVRFAAELVER
ncbi:thiamine-phosphate synthase family protein [Haladaptatus sp. NG-SE-30]